MTTMAGPRKTISIHDYPEHLNPFREEDNHNKIRFWTIGRKLSRSNSITFKDLKNSWSFRSFMKKGKREPPKEIEKTNHQANGDHLVEYRNALQYSSTSVPAQSRNTVGSPERADRYVYGGSVTPLPRSRFQERLRSPSNYDVNSLSATPRMARSEISGSRHSVGSTNPFDDNEPVAPVRAPRRKKKRAAPLPPVPSTSVTADDSVNATTQQSDLETSSHSVSEKIEINETGTTDLNDIHSSSPKEIKESNNVIIPNIEEEIEDLNCNIELKIVEDEEDQPRQDDNNSKNDNDIITATSLSSLQEKDNEKDITSNTVIKTGSEDDILDKVSFSKVDIIKYRRNSSVNDDDIRLRRGNLEDFHALSNKRSKSLTNTLDDSYVGYDINLNEDKTKDANDNDEPLKVARKPSIETMSSTEHEFIEIDRATRELEREISKLNSALTEDDLSFDVSRRSVSDMKQFFDKNNASSPNPIPKPRRSHYGDKNTLSINGNNINT